MADSPLFGTSDPVVTQSAFGANDPVVETSAGNYPEQLASNYAHNAKFAKSGPYFTQLPPDQEQQFRTWVKANKVNFDPEAKITDYDMRGFWLAQQNGQAPQTGINQYDHALHFTDEFKTPYDRTFSNESRFAKAGAPHWVDNRYLVDANGNVLFDQASESEDSPWPGARFGAHDPVVEAPAPLTLHVKPLAPGADRGNLLPSASVVGGGPQAPALDMSSLGTLPETGKALGEQFVGGGGALLNKVQQFLRSDMGSAAGPLGQIVAKAIGERGNQAEQFAGSPEQYKGVVPQVAGVLARGAPTLAATLAVPEAEAPGIAAEAAPTLSKIPGLVKLARTVAEQSPRAAALTALTENPQATPAETARDLAINSASFGPASVGGPIENRVLAGGGIGALINEIASRLQGQTPTPQSDLAMAFQSAVGAAAHAPETSHAVEKPEVQQPTPAAKPAPNKVADLEDALRRAGLDIPEPTPEATPAPQPEPPTAPATETAATPNPPHAGTASPERPIAQQWDAMKPEERAVIAQQIGLAGRRAVEVAGQSWADLNPGWQALFEKRGLEPEPELAPAKVERTPEPAQPENANERGTAAVGPVRGMGTPAPVGDHAQGAVEPAEPVVAESDDTPEPPLDIRYGKRRVPMPLRAAEHVDTGLEVTEHTPENAPPEARELVARTRQQHETAQGDAVMREHLREASTARGEAEANRDGLRPAVEDVLGTGHDVEFVRDVDGLPDDVRSRLPASEGRRGKRAGLHDPETGRTFVFTDAVHTPEDAAWTAAHEVTGHKGLRALINDRAGVRIGDRTPTEALDKALDMARQNPTVAKLADVIREQRKATKNGETVYLHPRTAAEEALAEISAATKTGNWQKLADRYGVDVPEAVREGVKGAVAKFVERLRRILHAVMGKTRFTDDQVHQLVADAGRYARADAGEIGGEGLEQRVYHGTPHTVDKFSLQKIGTGEGAQAYGWGMYFAGKKEIAEHYREMLSQPEITTMRVGDLAIKRDGEYTNLPTRTAPEQARALFAEAMLIHEQELARLSEKDVGAARSAMHRIASDLIAQYEEEHPPYVPEFKKLDAAIEHANVEAPKKGNLYHVEVPEDSDLLDWDKKLLDQPPHVKEILKSSGLLKKMREANADFSLPMFARGKRGQHLYELLTHELGGEQAASEYLNKLGIQGLRYDAGQIAGVKSGAHNYVIWDEGAIGEPNALESVTPDEHAQPQKPEDVLPRSFVSKTLSRLIPGGDDVASAVRMAVAPMAEGSVEARATAKDFANTMREARYQGIFADKQLTKHFSREQLEKMWNAADEQSVLEQKGEDTACKGLATLTPEERRAVEILQANARKVFEQARSLGMVEGEGLPSYTPRMVVRMGDTGPRPFPNKDNPVSGNVGRNVRTTSANLRQRLHLTATETEAAAKAKLGEDAELVRNIRTLPLATSKLSEAVAGRSLINRIKEIGKQTGQDTVREGAAPDDGYKWFTIQHPAFTTWRPRFETDPETGKVTAVKDENGNTVFDRVPIYVRGDFAGPLKAVLSEKSGPIYNGLMALKGKTMSVIMYSPLIHNAVEWGRALPAMPGKVLTLRVYFEGNRAKNDPETMREAIKAGLVPIGQHYGFQDISSIQEGPNIIPGRSWTAKLLAAVPNLFDKRAGDAVKRAIDKAGDIYHNKLLWDRVGDLQMGLYTNFRDHLAHKGFAPASAQKMAAHFANRYAGALPMESMSNAARKIANLLLFSRSFTLGNLGAMKDMVAGLPRDVQSQILRDGGMEELKRANAYSKRKAIAIIAADMALMYLGNSLLQSGIAVARGTNTLSDEEKGYMDRLAAAFDRVKENPLALLHPFNLVESLTPMSGNEPGKQDRVLVGHAPDGTAIYMRNPTGKIGEEFKGWLTSPLDMLKRKMGTFARPLYELVTNDKGFGRKVYDPYDDSTAGMIKNAGRIAGLFVQDQVPMQSIKAVKNAIQGKGDTTTNILQAAGPLAGVTFSKGAPGGPAVGIAYQAKDEHEFAVSEAIPGIRDMIRGGDTAGAVEKMRGLGMPPSYIRWVIRTTHNPSLRLSPKGLRDFQKYASPEARQQMREALDSDGQ